jgi:hypothetical protein
LKNASDKVLPAGFESSTTPEGTYGAVRTTAMSGHTPCTMFQSNVKIQEASPDVWQSICRSGEIYLGSTTKSLNQD